MRNFKKWIIGIIIFVIAADCFFALDITLYPCTVTRNDIHAVVTNRYDDLYLGTSHGKINIDPDAVQEINGRTGHNASVGNEYPVDAYYIAKLAIEKGNKPDRIIYEVSSGYLMQEKEEGNNNLLFYHEFPASASKVAYFFSAIRDNNIRTLLFPWYEYPLSYELSHIKKTLGAKLSRDYSPAVVNSSSTQEYRESGFIARYPVDTESLEPTGFMRFSEEEIRQENMDYLEKLIRLCKKEDIDFVAVITPLPEPVLEEYPEEYEAMDAFFGAFFEEQGVRYVNFNGDYMDAFGHALENYTDYDGHLNNEAAYEYSQVLAEILDA